MTSVAVLVLSLLVTFCNQLETAAQTITTSDIMPNTTVSQTDNVSSFISAVISSTVEVTSPDMTPVDVLTLTDMLNVSTVPVPLSPTNTIMMTSLLPMNSSFMMTIGTTTMASPSMDVADTVSTPITMTSTTTPSSSAVPITTTNVITTNNPEPVPEDGDSGFSTGAIIGIAAGGGTALLFVIILITCCCCCHHYRKHHHDELILMSPTIQTRPENCVIQRHDGLRDSKRSQLSFTGSLRSLRNSFRRPRGKDPDPSEGLKLMYQTPL